MKLEGRFHIITTAVFVLTYVATTAGLSAGIEAKCQDFPYHPVCPLYLQPLCGTNGVTYRNLCNLCFYIWGTGFKIKILHEGQCDIETGRNIMKSKYLKTS